MHACMYVRMYVCMYVYIYIYIYIHIHTYIHVHAYGVVMLAIHCVDMLCACNTAKQHLNIHVMTKLLIIRDTDKQT